MKNLKRLSIMFIFLLIWIDLAWIANLGSCDDASEAQSMVQADQYNFLNEEYCSPQFVPDYAGIPARAYNNGLGAPYQMIYNGTADYWVNEANRLYLAGSYEQAADSYANAVRLDPTLSEAWLSMGNALYLLNRYPESLNAYDSALRLEPNNADALKGKNQILLALNRSNEANVIQ